VNIGEGAFIDPYDEGGLAATLQTQQDHVRFRALAYKELRQGMASRMSVAQQRIMDFVQSIRTARPATSLGQKCGMDKLNNLAVDLHGNVLTCQNVSAAATAPNGQPHQIGHLSNLRGTRVAMQPIRITCRFWLQQSSTSPLAFRTSAKATSVKTAKTSSGKSMESRNKVPDA